MKMPQVLLKETLVTPRAYHEIKRLAVTAGIEIFTYAVKKIENGDEVNAPTVRVGFALDYGKGLEGFSYEP